MTCRYCGSDVVCHGCLDTLTTEDIVTAMRRDVEKVVIASGDDDCQSLHTGLDCCPAKVGHRGPLLLPTPSRDQESSLSDETLIDVLIPNSPVLQL